MTNQIIADVSVDPHATQWYGNLIVKNIRHKDGSAVTIHKFLGVGFKSPSLVNPSNFWYETKPYVEINAQIADRQVSADTFIVAARLNFPNQYTIDKSSGTQLTFGINGNLIKDPEHWTKSFVFTADIEPRAD